MLHSAAVHHRAYSIARLASLFEKFMMKTIQLSTVCLMFCLSLGCQSGMFRGYSQTVGYRSGGESENPAQQTSDPWIQDVGTYARSEHQREPVYDPLKLRNIFMSEKARDIERNLGIGD